MPRCGGSVIDLITDVDVVAVSIKRINLAIANTIGTLPPEDCFYAICVGRQRIIVLISAVLRMVIGKLALCAQETALDNKKVSALFV